MQEALKEAQKAAIENEVPIGAVLVLNNKIVARSHNQTELLKDVTAHAEILVITGAASELGIKFFEDFTLYVTLEPCTMCAGALKWARIGKIVYATDDPKAGFSLYSKNIIHPKTIFEKGPGEKESKILLQNFFKLRRKSDTKY
jgi:tRNA(adenine34) deaminase